MKEIMHQKMLIIANVRAIHDSCDLVICRGPFARAAAQSSGLHTLTTTNMLFPQPLITGNVPWWRPHLVKQPVVLCKIIRCAWPNRQAPD
jgi:hypothetical protein